LDAGRVLGVVEEVAEAGLVLGVPVVDVEARGTGLRTLLLLALRAFAVVAEGGLGLEIEGLRRGAAVGIECHVVAVDVLANAEEYVC